MTYPDVNIARLNGLSIHVDTQLCTRLCWPGLSKRPNCTSRLDLQAHGARGYGMFFQAGGRYKRIPTDALRPHHVGAVCKKRGLSDQILDQRGPVAGQLLALHCCPSRLGHGAKSGFLKPGIGAQASTPKAVYFTACRFLLRNWVTWAKPRCDCSSCSKCPRWGSNTVWASAKTPA